MSNQNDPKEEKFIPEVPQEEPEVSIQSTEGEGEGEGEGDDNGGGGGTLPPIGDPTNPPKK